MLPERLNLAIARRCPVACPGCYNFFGRHEPELDRFVASARVFAGLGVRALTLSGGDPLTLAGLLPFLGALRRAGMQSIKLDTVGVGLVDRAPGPSAAALLASVDHLGIPLDGACNETVAMFRRGRADLHERTLELLAALDAAHGSAGLIVNTVVHRGNVGELAGMQTQLAGLRRLVQWNLFQYTATDQASAAVHRELAIDADRFDRAGADFRRRFGNTGALVPTAAVAFRSTRDRLGAYLLVNSDGLAWLPDEAGLTRVLGPVFGREQRVLERWAMTVRRLHGRRGGTAVAA